MPPLVSIIIPTRNSAPTIRQCLESVKNQTYSNIETIVVDNNSHDTTVQIARNYGSIVFTRGPERSAQMNYGIRNSNGKYAYRLDSDMTAGPRVVEEAVEICELNSLDGVIIRVVSDPTVSFWSKVRSFERKNLYSYGSNVAVRFFSRNAFDKINGFDESLNGFEDYDLHDRFVAAGYRFGRINSNEIHLGEPKTLAEIVRKHAYYGRDLKKYLSGKSANRKQSAKRLSIIRSGQANLLSELRRQPIIFLGLIVYQSVRYLATALGMLS